MALYSTQDESNVLPFVDRGAVSEDSVFAYIDIVDFIHMCFAERTIATLNDSRIIVAHRSLGGFAKLG